MFMNGESTMYILPHCPTSRVPHVNFQISLKKSTKIKAELKKYMVKQAYYSIDEYITCIN